MATTPKDKALRDQGLAVLCERIKAIRATAEQSGSAVADLAEEFGKSLEEIEKLLNDVPQSTPVTIPVEGWKRSEEAVDGEALETGSSAYPFYIDLPVDGVTAADHATVTIAPESYRTAVDCGLCPSNETIQGAIRLRAANEPKAALSAEYWIEEGKE